MLDDAALAGDGGAGRVLVRAGIHEAMAARRGVDVGRGGRRHDGGGQQHQQAGGGEHLGHLGCPPWAVHALVSPLGPCGAD